MFVMDVPIRTADCWIFSAVRLPFMIRIKRKSIQLFSWFSSIYTALHIKMNETEISNSKQNRK